VRDIFPNALRGEQHGGDRKCAEQNQIPGAEVGKVVLHRVKHDHADSWTFDRADPPMMTINIRFQSSTDKADIHLDRNDRRPYPRPIGTGTREDGTIDPNALKAWIKEARLLAKVAGRGDIADSRIGAILSASPDGTDGIWPAEAVREVIDDFDSKPMVDGFWIGKRNRRGVTSRMPRDGGRLERDEAAKYRKFAAALAYEYPRTAMAPR
jgi:hypothetical protein